MTVLSYIVVGLVGVIVGYLAHIISLNVWLVRHGYNPKDFFENGTGKEKEASAKA